MQAGSGAGRRRATGIVAALALLLVLALLAAPTAAPAAPLPPPGCPSFTDPASFASTDQLYRWNEVEADFGARPTASPAHAAFIDWLQSKMSSFPGMQLGSVTYSLERQTETGASLALDDGNPSPTRIPISSTVPY